jgi:ATP-binding cassette subfamily B protein
VTEAAIVALPIMLVVAYGATRLFGTVFQQLRDLVFARVGQHALRQLGLRVFRHVHQLSLGYHISRKTGALSRVVDRGIKAIDFLLRYLLFSIVPLLFELGVVAVIFFVEFGPEYVLVLVATIAAYVAFTFRLFRDTQNLSCNWAAEEILPAGNANLWEVHLLNGIDEAPEGERRLTRFTPLE